jgi:hypothetical protein
MSWQISNPNPETHQKWQHPFPQTKPWQGLVAALVPDLPFGYVQLLCEVSGYDGVVSRLGMHAILLP